MERRISCAFASLEERNRFVLIHSFGPASPKTLTWWIVLNKMHINFASRAFSL
jgi:hypothetical protein